MNSSTKKFPAWIRRTWNADSGARDVKQLLSGLGLHTVCQSAQCPNQAECWSRRTATVMILGDRCTRRCMFCAVHTAKPLPVDPEEPARVAELACRLGLRHMVVTAVTRDDLPDGGAAHFAQTIKAIRQVSPQTTIEVLTPDFNANLERIERVLAAGPAVFGHNIETVERVFRQVRDRRFDYRRSLETLRIAQSLAPDSWIKSALMLGLGETDTEIESTLRDLLEAGCSAVAMGQYLQPTAAHAPVEEFVPPERFAALEALASSMGFRFAVAGPFVRSSYRSEALFDSVKHGVDHETS